MDNTGRKDVSSLPAELSKGNEEAASRLIAPIYGELRRMAGNYMRRERSDHTLQPTALVHEAFLKLVEQRTADRYSRSHFFAIAAQMMRRILIDHARRHLRTKRGSGQKLVPLNEALAFTPEQSAELIKLNHAVERLTELDPRLGKIVELRFFGGLTVEETAGVLGISTKTVKRDWSLAKAWLHGEMRD